MTYEELLEDLASHFNVRPYPIRRPVIYEPWRDRWERWLDAKLSRACVQELRGNRPLWLWTYRKIRRSRAYRSFIMERF